MTLSLPVSELRAQANGELNSEQFLASFAENNRIALHAIETIDEQLSLFDGLAEAKQVEMLRLAVQSNDIIDELFARMIDAYLARDLNGVYRLMEEMTAQATVVLEGYRQFASFLSRANTVRLHT